MGCFPSSYNQINSEYTFSTKDILYLRQSWNIIKSSDYLKFGQDVLIKTSNENLSFRKYCRTKIEVEGNNYDYGEHDSCLKSDKSWHIGFKDYSPRLISIFDQLISMINQPQFIIYLQSIIDSEHFFFVDNQGLFKCMMDILEERWKIIIDNTSNEIYRNIWQKFFKFLLYSIEYLNKTPMILINSLNMNKE